MSEILKNENLKKEEIPFKNGTNYMIQRNLQTLLNILLEQISDFKQSTPLKVKSFVSLSFIIENCGELIEPDYFSRNNGIFYCIYKYFTSEEPLVQKCEECSVIIGKHTNPDILIPLIIKSISEIEVGSSLESLYVRIRFLANYLSQLQNLSLENGQIILKCLSTLDVFNMQTFNYTQQLLYSYAGVYSSLINCLKEKCATVHDSLFFPLLLLVSLPETVAIRKDITQTMNNFASNCKLSLEELYSYEIGNILERFKSTYKTWKKNTPDRFAFDIYVKLAGPSLEKHWTEVLLIISQCCESEKDIEIRMDMIILLDKIITQQALFEQIKNYIEFILPEILFPSMSWRAGRPNYKVRKAAIVDMIHIFQNNLISPEIALKYFSDFVSNLKTTLDDDWDAELRYLSIQLVKLFLKNTSEVLKYDHISELYTILLKRLDDSQDTNRILTCEVLILFMSICKRLNLSTSIYDYIIENSFIHLDDPNEKVREAIEKYLMEALTLYPQNFLKFVEKNENSFTHKSNLLTLKDAAQKLL